MAQILLIGQDTGLLATRAAVLGKTGASVTCCAARAAGSLLQDHDFDIVVLCHTLADAEITEFTAYLHRRWPEAKILKVIVINSFEPEPQGSDISSSADPGQLFKRTQQLLESLPEHRLRIISSSTPTA
ncbi:MAG TPA: hypothetical protein VK593_07420 [Edaphobacter sp.]|nr:hypothetical protein [Edaphobacter sp.]